MIESFTPEATVTDNGEEPRRLVARPVAVTIGLEIVADDGTQLHPIETRPLRIPASAWADWHLDVAVAQIQTELDQQ